MKRYRIRNARIRSRSGNPPTLESHKTVGEVIKEEQRLQNRKRCLDLAKTRR